MAKFKIALSDTIFPKLEIECEEVKKTGGELVVAKEQTEVEIIKVVKDVDAIVVTYAEITEKIINAAKKCKIIVRTGIGVNNINIEAATERGIYVANVPDYCFDEVSDHAIALAFALSRKIVMFDRKVKNKEWNHEGVKPKGFGFNVIAYDPYIKPEVAEEMGVKLVDIKTLLKESDFISLHTPLTPETKHLINEETLKLMKPTAFLINTARGHLVDEEALNKALKDKWIAGAALDVMEQEPPVDNNPLLALDNIILTPHAAFVSEKSIIVLRRKSMQEAIRGALGEKPKNWVNKKAMEFK